jgi:hypothetical protein
MFYFYSSVQLSKFNTNIFVIFIYRKFNGDILWVEFSLRPWHVSIGSQWCWSHYKLNLSDCCLNAEWAIFQPYHAENKLHFYEIMTMSADKLYLIILYQVHLTMIGIWTYNISGVIGTDCKGSCKSNYHTITMAPEIRIICPKWRDMSIGSHCSTIKNVVNIFAIT